MATKIQLRRDTAGNWASANPILRDGELGVVKGTSPVKVKIGDGSTAFGALPFLLRLKTINGQPVEGEGDIELAAGNVYNTEVTLSGGNMAALSAYDDLSAALAAIGSTPTTLLLDETATISVATVIPANVRLLQTNGATLTKSSSGTVEFEGLGLVDPESQAAIFSGFAAGDVTWTGEVPARISSSLWANSSLTAKLRRAVASMANKQCTIIAHPGELTAKCRVTAGKAIHFTRGNYTNISTECVFVLEDNTRLSGDGIGQTFINESVNNQIQFVRSSGMEAYPFDGYNENIVIEDFTFVGNDGTAVETSSATIIIGNVKTGVVRRCEFDHTHGFAIYVGGFGTAGHDANGCYIVDNICRGLQTQNVGTIGGRNVFISRNLFIVKESSASLAVIDVEPNDSTFGSDNIQITDNIIDARLAQTACNGITVQQGGGSYLKNIRIAGNQIIGADNTAISFRDDEINLTTNEITYYEHGMQTGQQIALANNGGSGTTLPNGATPPWYGFIISTGLHTFKLASSFANAMAGTAIDLTTTGSNNYTVVPVRYMSNAIQVFKADYCVVENNQISGASQNGISILSTYRLILRNNVLSDVGGGGNHAINLQESVEGEIYNNLVLSPPYPQSHSTAIVEANGSITVNTTSGSPIVAGVGITLPMKWWLRGLTITIGGTDYIISQRLDDDRLILASNVSATLSGVSAVIKSSSNRYRGNRCGSITMAAGTSVILDGADDRLITNVADTAHTATSISGIIVYTSLTAGRTVTLPAAATCRGKEVVIKDGAGAAGTHNITIDGDGSETIDGAATYVISSNYGRVTVKSNGTNWITV